MEDKKNAYRFTLQFNKNDPRHERAVDILNQQGRGVSQFIVTAVTHYLDCNLQPLDPLLQSQIIEKLVNEAVQRTVPAYPKNKTADKQASVPKTSEFQAPELTSSTANLSESDQDLLNNALSSFG